MRNFILFLVALIAFILAYSALVQAPTEISADQAKVFVLEDLKKSAPQGTDARIVNAEKTGEKWAIDVLLSKNSHGTCPTVEKRFYTLMPIGYRSENVVDSCTDKVNINYREEALIQSTKLVKVSRSAYGCAFFGDEYKTEEAKSYCKDVNAEQLDSLKEGLEEEAWLVQWTPGKFVALSKNGKLLKSS